jgi:hypothetical protein
MNLKQRIINWPERHVRITAIQAQNLIAQCSQAEWQEYTLDAYKSGRGCLAIINKTRVLGPGKLEPTFPGVDDALSTA